MMMRWLMCAAIVLAGAGQAAAIDIWLSTSGTPSAPPSNSGEVPAIHDFQSQGTGSVFVWARPDDTKTLDRWSLRLTSSNPSILSFDASSIEVPYNLVDDLGDGNASNDVHRWEFTHGPAGDTSQVDLFGFNIGSMNPARIAEGIGTLSSECNAKDEFCGLASDNKNSWLLAKINYTLSGVVGHTDLSFEIGTAGIGQMGEPSSAASVRFGGDASFENALNGEHNRLGQVTGPHPNVNSFRDARIDVHADPDSDFDSDGDVDGYDFLTWQRGLGKTGINATKAEGNATDDTAINVDDRIIDEIDLAAWEFQFGMGLGGFAGLSGNAVPEPTTGALAVLSAVFIVGRRRTMRFRDQKSRGAN